MGKKHLGVGARDTPIKLAIPPANIIAVEAGFMKFFQATNLLGDFSVTPFHLAG
jgi:hypothetical protein